jgi:hypothetical protein
VAEQRQPRIRVGIELQRHAHVAEAAGGRQKLRGCRRIAEQTAAFEVDDQVGHRQALEKGAERGRLVGAANDRGRPRGACRSQWRQSRRNPRADTNVTGRSPSHVSASLYGSQRDDTFLCLADL